MENFTEPKLPENPIRYNTTEEKSVAMVLLMMAPLWIILTWILLYFLVCGFKYIVLWTKEYCCWCCEKNINCATEVEHIQTV